MDDEKVKWTLDLITKLQDSNIGNKSRLDSIKDALQGGRTVYDSDKNYLKDLYQQLQSSNNEKSSRETTTEELLELIKKLEQAEIGNPEKLESITSSLNAGKSLSKEENDYLNQKLEHLEKINPNESKIRKALDTVEKLQLAEIGNSERLESIKKRLVDSGSLPPDEKSYLIEKSKQLSAIENKNLTPAKKEIQRKRPKPVDPDARYCAYCQRSVHPEKDFSVAALVVLLFLGIIPGIIYYFLKAPTCPICKHNQWQIPPDDDHS